MSLGQEKLGIIQGEYIPRSFIPGLIELYKPVRFPFDRMLKFYAFSKINQAIANATYGDTIRHVLRIETPKMRICQLRGIIIGNLIQV